MGSRTKKFYWLAALFLLASCAEAPVTQKENFNRTPVDFSDLPGWQRDHVAEAVPALSRSCAALKKKSEWSGLCAALANASPQGDAQTRAFFEQWFQPYAVSGKEGSKGLFTGYYEAGLEGSLQQGEPFQTPLYARPDDLISVDLGAFKTDLHGQTIAGKVTEGKHGKQLVPYDDRATIAKGSLAGRAQPLVWVDDPVEAFFLAIQGSGRVHLQDNSTMRVGYDATNGRPYVAIGRILADKNDIAKPVTMPAIRAWLAAHPDKAQAVMNLDTSYVFFRKIDDETTDGPIGAEGVALTPQRSLAVDPAFVALGTPVWLDTADGFGKGLQRLMIAQDTGGAIKGAVRGDFFWGYGKDAETQAGAMQSEGRYFVLLPKTSDARS